MVSPQHWEAPPGNPPHPEPPHLPQLLAQHTLPDLNPALHQFDADTDPGADGGGGGKFIALATAASLNLKSMLNDELMSMHLNPLFTASNAPTQLAWCGPKITRPFEAVAAPLNAWPPLYVLALPVLIVELTSKQLNALVAALKIPTQLELNGANTTKPFGATAAPPNLLLMLVVALMSMQLNALVVASKVPTQSAL